MADVYMQELLKWPGPTQRTANSRPNGPFRVGAFKTEKFLKDELYKISARNIVLKTFHPERAHRRDGGIRVDAKAPWHPGVILEFEKPQYGDDGSTTWIKMTLPCDTYRFWEDNLRAIAMVLEGLRMIDRHEVSQGAQYQGYLALPPKPGEMTVDDAVEYMREHGDLPDNPASRAMLLSHLPFAEYTYKLAAKKLHPDKGGDAQEFAKLEKAMSMIREHFKEPASNVVEGKFATGTE